MTSMQNPNRVHSGRRAIVRAQRKNAARDSACPAKERGARFALPS